MTLTEAQAELTALRGLAPSGKGLADFKARVDALYYAVCSKHLRSCKCKDVINDALIEIQVFINRQTKKTMNANNHVSRLVRGVVLKVGTNHYTNVNLTDEVARQFLAEFPQRADWFEILPPKAEPKVTAESAEAAPNNVEEAERPTTPEKKKNARKRK